MCERGFFCFISQLFVTKIITLVYPLTNFLADVSIVLYTSVINMAGSVNITDLGMCSGKRLCIYRCRLLFLHFVCFQHYGPLLNYFEHGDKRALCPQNSHFTYVIDPTNCIIWYHKTWVHVSINFMVILRAIMQIEQKWQLQISMWVRMRSEFVNNNITKIVNVFKNIFFNWVIKAFYVQCVIGCVAMYFDRLVSLCHGHLKIPC